MLAAGLPRCEMHYIIIKSFTENIYGENMKSQETTARLENILKKVKDETEVKNIWISTQRKAMTALLGISMST